MLALDDQYDDPGKLSVNALLTAVGHRALWKYPNLFSFLFKEKILPHITKDEVEDFVELRKQRRLLSNSGEDWAARILADYHQDLLAMAPSNQKLGRQLKMKTITVSLSASSALLQHAAERGIRSAHQLTRDDLDGFLRAKPGLFSSVRRFIHWLNRNKKVFREISLPKSSKQNSNVIGLSIPKQRALFQKWISSNGDKTKPAIIGLFMMLYAQPPKRIAAMRIDQVRRLDDGSYEVQFAKVPIKLGDAESALMERYLIHRRRWSVFDDVTSSPWLFPGRGWKERLSEASIGKYIQSWGTTASELFSTSMRSIYAEGLQHPKVPVDALGMRVITSVKYFAIMDPTLAASVSIHGKR